MNDQFEVEVEQTLADLAKVDAATLAETRASIAALPDRGSYGAARFLVRLPDLSIRRSPAFALAGVVAILVAMVAVSAFGRFQIGPLAPGLATPAVESGWPTQTPTPGGTATPSPTARPTPAFREMLPVVLTGESMSVLGWAPDGSSFAILEQPRGSALAPPTPTVHLFDRTGAEEGSIEASGFAWLDAGSFVILRSEAPADGAQTAHGYRAYVGLIGSSELTALGTYDSLVSGPSGSVALTLAWDWTLTPQPHYVVMSGATLSEPRDGYPVAWSPDGSELAVFHVTEVGGGIGGHPAGWLEVVRSTGVSVASARSVRTGIISQVAFSPDGARVAFGDDTNAAVQGERIGVLEIGTGSLRRIPGFGPFTWASSDELLIADHSSEIPSQNNRILSWSETTAQLTTYGAGNIVGASGRGAVVTGTDGTGSLSWVNRSPGDTASETLAVGAGPWMGIPDAAWSPYGESLVLISGDEFSALMDAVLVHP